MQPTPRHIAICMDGNGRWAVRRGLQRTQGHRHGARRAVQIVDYCRRLGIRYVTLFTFSRENWSRPAREVASLMDLLRYALATYGDRLVEHGVALTVIGDDRRLPDDIRRSFRDLCRRTAGGTKLHLTLALSYGARDEITRATRRVCQDVLAGKLRVHEITETVLASYLDTRRLPDPDLFIRTSGEMRLSNFLLWQLSYTELYVTPTLWPDFSRAQLDQALAHFRTRQRRWGGAPLPATPSAASSPCHSESVLSGFSGGGT
ncbi:MAG: polyprenyl diphosphate synthase [Myxococcota bacterium]